MANESENFALLIDGEECVVHVRRHPRSRSIRLSYDPVRQKIGLTLPKRASLRQAQKFALEKSNWLAGQLRRSDAPGPLASTMEIPFEGRRLSIVSDPSLSRGVHFQDDRLLVGGPAEFLERRVRDWMKAEARRHMTDDLDHYCGKIGVAPPRLTIGDARTRWGSCSARGAIRLNWRLVMAPPDVRRSVVAHEVAHLLEMNHSPAFYAKLDDIFEGNRMDCDRWLKDNGLSLRLTLPA